MSDKLISDSLSFRKLTLDAKKPKIFPKNKFAASTSIERSFLKQLLKVARVSGKIVEKYLNGSKITNPRKMLAELNEYSRIITPWAERQSKTLVNQTIKRINSDRSYREHSQRIGKLLSEEIFEREILFLTREIFKEQVELFKSIPTKAGDRAIELSVEAVAGGRRADEVALELKKTTEVTESRARTIARTEVARANSVLNEARARSVGSTKYRWRNSQDEAVRHSHEFYKGKKLDGLIFSWDNPPTLDDGTTGHPGSFPNCRCYAEPVFDEI